MATLLRAAQRDFKENPGRKDPYRLFSDFSATKEAVNSRNLFFDLRQLNPDQFSSPYHFHRHAEELFLILSGSATLRTSDGFEVVAAGDIAFFEAGETGAHQLYNHTDEPCVYLDVRSFLGQDVCEYPDSGKVLLAPSMEVFGRNARQDYWDGEEDIRARWMQMREK